MGKSIFADLKDMPRMMGYGFDSLRKNPILLLPNLVMIVISVCLFMIVYNVGGIHDLIATKTFILEDKVLFNSELSGLINSPKFTISAIVWILGEFLIGAYFVVMKYGMIRDVIKDGKTSIKSGLLFAEKHYGRFLGIYIISRLILSVMMFVLLLIYLLFVTYNMVSFSFTTVLLAVFGLVLGFYFFTIAARLFYTYPVMVFEDDSVFGSFDHSFHYVKSHSGHSYISFLIVVAFFIGLQFFDGTVRILFFDISSVVLVSVIAILMLIFEIILTTWEHIFFFKSYVEGKKMKKEITAAKKIYNEKKKAKKSAK